MIPNTKLPTGPCETCGEFTELTKEGICHNCYKEIIENIKKEVVRILKAGGR